MTTKFKKTLIEICCAYLAVALAVALLVLLALGPAVVVMLRRLPPMATAAISAISIQISTEIGRVSVVWSLRR